VHAGEARRGLGPLNLEGQDRDLHHLGLDAIEGLPQLGPPPLCPGSASLLKMHDVPGLDRGA